MRIGIIGTGAVGQAFSRALPPLGHSVVVGTRDPETTATRDAWRQSAAELVAYEELSADLYLCVTSGYGALEALPAVGPALAGKTVIDTSNPLDFSAGFPPRLFVSGSDSLAEQLQRQVPQARLVKMFSTTANEVMVDPGQLGQETTLFVAGNDTEAKAEASTLARQLGWTDVLDLGDLTGARALEQWLPLWLRLYGVIGNPAFNIKVVR